MRIEKTSYELTQPVIISRHKLAQEKDRFLDEGNNREGRNSPIGRLVKCHNRGSLLPARIL